MADGTADRRRAARRRAQSEELLEPFDDEDDPLEVDELGAASAFDDDVDVDSFDDAPSPFDDDESELDESVSFFAEPRLSFLKKPLPRKVTPTGWKTFLTAIFRPVSGCS